MPSKKKKEPEQTGITFVASVIKISTHIDGSWNLTLSVNQTEVEQIMLLSEIRDQLTQVAIVPLL